MAPDYRHRLGEALGHLLAEHVEIIGYVADDGSEIAWRDLGHHLAEELDLALRSSPN